MKVEKSNHIANRSHFRIAIIAVLVFVLAIMAFFVFIPKNDSNSGEAFISPNAASAKTIVKEDPTVSEDSIRREFEREGSVCKRAGKVCQSAERGFG